MPVIKARNFYLPPPNISADAWDRLKPAERVIVFHEHDQRRRLPRPSGVDAGRPLWARIDSGRWVVECECGSAQVVDPTDPRFFCVNCLSDLKWRPVKFPKDVAKVETDVEKTPEPHERWWWAVDDPHPRNPRRRSNGGAQTASVIDVRLLQPEPSPGKDDQAPGPGGR